MTLRKQISNVALMLLLCVYVAEAFTGQAFNVLTAAAGAIVLILNIPYMGKTFKAPAWVFCGLGAAVLIIGRAPVSQWIYGFNSMMKTVVILIAVQTLSLAINIGRYEDAVSGVMGGKIRSKALFFIMLLLLSHLLAGVMSLGSVVIIIAAVLPAAAGRIRNEKHFIAEAITIGYCTLFLWAPGTVTVLMSMQIFDLSWGEYFIPAITLAAIGLALGCIVGYIKYNRRNHADDIADADADALKSAENEPTGVEETDKTQAADVSPRRKIVELISVLALIVMGISILESIGFSNASGRMIVVSLIVSAIWIALIKGRNKDMRITELWWHKKLPGNNDLYTFFLAMGIFSAGISYSGLDAAMAVFGAAHGSMIAAVVIPVLPLVIIALSLIGIHPFISVIMVGQILTSMSLGVSDLQLGLTMSLGCCLSYMVSPFAGLILTMSDNLKLTPAEICFKINLRFAILYYVVALIYIYAIG